MRNHSIQKQPVRRIRFARRYTAEDVALLADVDAAHEDLSGPAIRHVLHREFTAYGKAAYERLAGISVSHIYNLRHSERYRQSRVRMHHTQARGVSIAERRKPDPQGKPGYLRVDTVHQGQHDGQPGIYHINAVDTVTQWQVIGCVETICERDLIPVLEAMFHQFPFRILGFHSDNGSEFLNHRVEKMLNKLLVEFTKSRAYRTTDNALVEGKNGAVVRKHMGYGAIGAEHAAAFQKFYTAYFNPYLNYHRPCGFADIQTRARGHKRRVYHRDDYQTPYEKLISLADWQQHLKDGVTVEFLHDQAQQMSDTEAARRMQKAKLALLAKSRGKQ
jgi:transposase InsO family protein